MNWQTHVTVGVTTAAGACSALHAPLLTTGMVAVVSGVASLIPDSDHADSKIHQWSKLEDGHPILKPFGFIARIPFRPLVFLPHRGPTHWLVTWLGLTALIALASRTWIPSAATVLTAGFLIGYGMHILADMCTVSGVPALAPFSKRECRVLPKSLCIKSSNGFIQAVLSFVVTAGALFILWTTYA